MIIITLNSILNVTGSQCNSYNICLLYTSDAADEEDSVDLGGRRIIKKKIPHCALTKLQRVQNTAARVLCLAPRFCNITPILYELHWLPVTFRIEFKVIIITHKAIYGTAPNYLSSLVNFKPNSSYSLESNNKYLLSNPNFRTLPTHGDKKTQLYLSPMRVEGS